MRKALAASAALATMAFGAPAALAAAPKDYSQIARNVIPSGQSDPGETLAPGMLPNDAQAQMYNALTPLFNHVTSADINQDFKSEKFGTAGQCPCSTESVPYKGVTIIRDKYNVPHVSATSHAGGVWASGWIAAQDRGLLLEQARYDSLVAAIDAPGLSAIGLIEHLDNFTPSAQTEKVVSRQTKVLLKAGAQGRAVLRDIDTYIKGINAYNAIHNPTEAKYTRNDIYAFNALKDQFFGEGGGNQAQNSEFLSGLEQRLGTKHGYSVFNDLRQNTNAGSPTTVDGTFNYNHDPARPGAKGSVLLKQGSYTPVNDVSKTVSAGVRGLEPRAHASNELMVEGKYSATGHPILVGGPQVGYFYPGLTYEIDMHAPWPRLAWSHVGPVPRLHADRARAGLRDDADVGRRRRHRRVRRDAVRQPQVPIPRQVHPDGALHAGTITTESGRKSPVRFWTTVNGPVIGHATVGPQPVAITSKRASAGKDVLDLLFNRQLSDGQVHSPQSFIKAAALTPQTFNSFYVDSKHVAEITTGLLPLRAKGTDASLPTIGNGRYQWRGYLSTKGHPQGIDPTHTPVKGTMVNWNNVVGPRIRLGAGRVRRQRLGRTCVAAQPRAATAAPPAASGPRPGSPRR